MFTVTFDSKHDLFKQLQSLHLLPEQPSNIQANELSVEELLSLVQQALPGKVVQVLDAPPLVTPVKLPEVPPPAPVVAEKRKPGRPPKTKPAEPAAPAEEVAEEVKEVTPEEAMIQAMDILTPLYNNAAAKEKVLQLRDKYGVKKFALLPPEQACALLADAQLLQAELAGGEDL